MAAKLDPADRSPPYISENTFTSVIRRLRKDGLPSRLNHDSIRQFSSALRRQIFTGFKFLHLIDIEGRPISSLVDVVDAYDTELWPKRIEFVIRESYAPLFELPLQSIKPAAFQKAFADLYPGSEAVSRKCITFFITISRTAEIPLSAGLIDSTRPRGGRPADTSKSPTTTLRTKKTGAARSSSARNTPQHRGESSHSASDSERHPRIVRDLTLLIDENTMTAAELDAVWTLIKYCTRSKGAQS